MKKLFIFTVVLSITNLSALAHINAEYTTSKNYMLNMGYSSAMNNYAEIVTRDPYASTDDIYPEKNAAHFFKILWKKIDPTAYPNINNTWHDIKMNTGFGDLN